MKLIRPVYATQKSADDLAKIYLKVVNYWAVGARDRIIPEYQKTLTEMNPLTVDSVPFLEFILGVLNDGALQLILSTIEEDISVWVRLQEIWHRRKFNNILTDVTNIDLKTPLGSAEVKETLEAIVARNVALVRSVSDQTRERIADIVYRGVTNRTPTREIAKLINEATKLGKARSLRIASDQSVKLMAVLDKERQLEVGITSFKWIHSGKKHFREWHKERDGKIFEWNGEVARTDPPGFAPFCGCKAAGVFNGDD